jgi:hypothetical protein
VTVFDVIWSRCNEKIRIKSRLLPVSILTRVRVP